MAKNFVSRGVTMDYKNSGTEVIPAGTVVPLAGMIGIAETDIAPGKVGVLLTEGVFRLPKGSSSTFTQGVSVVWDEDSGTVAVPTSSASAGQSEESQAASQTDSPPPAGIVWADAGSGVASVLVKLNA